MSVPYRRRPYGMVVAGPKAGHQEYRSPFSPEPAVRAPSACSDPQAHGNATHPEKAHKPACGNRASRPTGF